MAPKYIAFFVLVFICGSIIGLMLEGAMLGEEQQLTLNPVLVWEQVNSEESWGILSSLNFVRSYFESLWKVGTWNFSFFTGNWVYLKWIIWTPLFAMFVWGLVMTFISLIQRIIGT